MKTFLVLMSATIMVSGCVPQSKYDEVKSEKELIELRFNEMVTENKNLKKDLERVEKELNEKNAKNSVPPLNRIEKIKYYLDNFSGLRTRGRYGFEVSYNSNARTLYIDDQIFNLNELKISYDFNVNNNEVINKVRFDCIDEKKCLTILWNGNLQKSSNVQFSFFTKEKCYEFIDLIDGL